MVPADQNTLQNLNENRLRGEENTLMLSVLHLKNPEP